MTYRGYGRGYTDKLCFARRWMQSWDFVVLCSDGILDSRRRSTTDKNAVSCHDCLDLLVAEDADRRDYLAMHPDMENAVATLEYGR